MELFNPFFSSFCLNDSVLLPLLSVSFDCYFFISLPLRPRPASVLYIAWGVGSDLPPLPSHLLSPLTPSPSRLLHTNKDDVTSSWLALRHELLTLWGCSHTPASPRTPPCRQVQQVSGFASRVTVCRSVFTLREILQSLGEPEETACCLWSSQFFWTSTLKQKQWGKGGRRDGGCKGSI